MHKLLRSILISIIFLFSFLSPVYAKLYINEFSSFTTDNDWIELYNTDPNELDLGNYCLRDNSKTNKLQLNGTLAATGFIKFDWQNKLNRDEDSIKLFFNCDENQTPIDQVVYGKSEKDITAPGNGQTAGRKTDGGEEWTIFAEATEGKPNTAPLAPAETPIPTNIPSPTRTPTPTKTPAPTKAPTPTKIPTPTKTPTLKPTSPLSPTPKINFFSPTKTKTTQPSAKPTRKLAPTTVLGISDKSDAHASSSKKVKPKSKTLVQASTDTKLPTMIIFTSVAVILIACAILFFLKIKRKALEN